MHGSNSRRKNSISSVSEEEELSEVRVRYREKRQFSENKHDDSQDEEGDFEREREKDSERREKENFERKERRKSGEIEETEEDEGDNPERKIFRDFREGKQAKRRELEEDDYDDYEESEGIGAEKEAEAILKQYEEKTKELQSRIITRIYGFSYEYYACHFNLPKPKKQFTLLQNLTKQVLEQTFSFLSMKDRAKIFPLSKFFEAASNNAPLDLQKIVIEVKNFPKFFPPRRENTNLVGLTLKFEEDDLADISLLDPFLSRMKHLELRLSPIRSDGDILDLNYLKWCKSLTDLKLHIGFTGIEVLTNCTRLTSLSLYDWDHGSSCADLKELTSLKDLTVEGLQDIENVIQALSVLTNLESLDIREMKIDSLDCLKNNSNLLKLKITQSVAPDIAVIQHLPLLRQLDLSSLYYHYHEQEADLSALAFCTHLEKVRISAREINTDVFANSKKLKEFILSAGSFSEDASFEKFLYLESLEIRNANSVRIPTFPSIGILREDTKLSGLKLFSLYRMMGNFNENMAEMMKNFGSLEVVFLEECRGIENVKFLDGCPKLKELSLQESNEIKFFSKSVFPEMKSLTLWECQIDEDFSFSKYPALKTLFICQIGLETLPSISSCTLLEELNINDSDNIDSGEIEQLQNLTKLELHFCPGAIHVELIGDLEKLQELELEEIHVEDYTFFNQLKDLRFLFIHTYDSMPDFEEISKCVNLESLLIQDSEIEDVEKIVKILPLLKCKKLKWLKIKDMLQIIDLEEFLQNSIEGLEVIEVDGGKWKLSGNKWSFHPNARKSTRGKKRVIRGGSFSDDEEKKVVNIEEEGEGDLEEDLEREEKEENEYKRGEEEYGPKEDEDEDDRFN